MIGEECVSVWWTVVRVLIVYVAVEDRHRTLFTKLEARVWRKVKSFRTVERRDRGAVVLSGDGAGDIKPIPCNVHRLAELNRDGGVVRHVDAVRDRLGGQLIPPQRLRELLAAAGCPTRPSELGLTASAFRATYVRARMIRRRYTVLDLATEAGVLGELVDELFAPGGFWADEP